MGCAAVFTGLRVSEPAGVLWRNVHAGSITIEQRYWKFPNTQSISAE